MTPSNESTSVPVRSLCTDDRDDGVMPVRKHRVFPVCPNCGAPHGAPCFTTPEGRTWLVHEERRPLELF